jgi:transcription-repair coupling factor (superfamily II helicase)
MSLADLLAALFPAAVQIANALPHPPLVLGLRRSARLPVAAALYEYLNAAYLPPSPTAPAGSDAAAHPHPSPRPGQPVPLLLVTDRHDHALALLDELARWLPDSPRLLFPEPNPLFYENAPWGMNTRRDRLAVLSTLASYHIPGAVRPPRPPIIIASVRSLMTRTLPRSDFLKAARTIKVNQVVRPNDLLHQAAHLGYEVVNTVLSPGQVARRGGILDLWAPAESQPVRVEFFGDEIDTLRAFDPATQRTTRPLDRLQLFPAREILPPPSGSSSAPGAQASDLDVHEFLIPVFHPLPASLLDYLPRGALVLLDDAQLLQDTLAEIEEQALGLRRDYIADGLLADSFPIPYLSWSEIEDSLTNRQVVDLGGSRLPDMEAAEIPPPASIPHPSDSPAPGPAASPSAELALQTGAGSFLPQPRFAGRLKPVMEYLESLARRAEPAWIVSRQAARLNELWQEHRQYLLLEDPSFTWQPAFLEASFAEGWAYTPAPGPSFHLLTDGEIFGWRRPEPRQRHRPQAEAPEAAYADLQPGDWVVHVDHGIGRFVDLVRRTVDAVEREFLCVEYAEADQLFVPVYQADRLTRYVGPEGKEPTPSRLGSAEWRGVREHVKEAVVEVAEDLLELYARRQVVVGHSFNADNPWQQELEASFPYIETDDQLRVIAEVKRDMENSRPMDRLICGDVGYGKTEVALRAAFKAVLDGYQVAMLVPTTILAQQHYHTFQERLAAFPAEVEMLSRFRTPQQQKDILQRLSEGKVDIVIGTHRLLGSDVQFKNLGLLIIDEEQRFGVMHKESLKKMRTEVDVLTLTATPIPRTLYMALAGVRDISTINTPPEERLPIITHVGPYSPKLVRQAILRELERGGQVFFVHNRVQTIGAMHSHLEKLVPEARMTIAHGQMAENELSERMELFASGEVDVLLSTSIIESGLDIPNANTLIVDRADTFGLAQLYQLKGRVGRGAQRAYAYFFRHSKRLPTSEGRERLETIAENTQLGAGFSIAMRDLEIRGTGDILGTRQHGNIAAVGFHLYTRLLADAVRRLRLDRQSEGMAPLPAPADHLRAFLAVGEIRPVVTVDVPLHQGIPASYIADRETRLRLYRRIADARSQAELDALSEEFSDRFGPLPEETRNLFFQVSVRILAESVGLQSIGAEGGHILLRYPPLPENAPPRRFPVLGSDVRSGKNSLWLSIAGNSDWQGRLLEVLRDLISRSALDDLLASSS